MTKTVRIRKKAEPSKDIPEVSALKDSPRVNFDIIALVSTYNSAEFIENRIRNLLQQTAKNVLIYVADASSEQNEGSIIKENFKEHITLDPTSEDGGRKIFYDRLPERLGLYATWNWMIQKYNIPYIATCNTDDIIAPEYLQSSMDELNHSNCHITFCDWYCTRVVNQQWPPSITDGISKQDLYTTCGHFPVWRRELHAKNGMFDERFLVCGDAEWWRRIRHYGAKETKINETLGCWANRGKENLYWLTSETGDVLHQTEEQMYRRISYT